MVMGIADCQHCVCGVIMSLFNQWDVVGGGYTTAKSFSFVPEYLLVQGFMFSTVSMMSLH